MLKSHPGTFIFKNPAKKAKHETKIIKNWNANMFKNIVKHITAQSFLVNDFYGYPKYLKSFVIHQYKPTQETHDKQVPKQDFW